METNLVFKNEASSVELTKKQQREYLSILGQAKGLVMKMDKMRFEIAGLAVKACNIIHGGGGHWNSYSSQLTVKKFAEDLDVSYKTLHTWIKEKTFVYDRLPENLKNIDYTKIASIYRKLGSDSTREEIVEAALRFNNSDEYFIESTIDKIVRYSKGLEHAMQRATFKKKRVKDLKLAKERILFSLKRLNEII